jgi:hypothetical protein
MLEDRTTKVCCEIEPQERSPEDILWLSALVRNSMNTVINSKSTDGSPVAGDRNAVARAVTCPRLAAGDTDYAMCTNR